MTRHTGRYHPILAAMLTLCVLLSLSAAAGAQDATPAVTAPDAPVTTEPIEPDPPVPTVAPSPTPVPDEDPAEPTATPEPTLAIATETPVVPAATTDLLDVADGASSSILALEATSVSPEDPVVVQATCIGGVITPPTVTFATTAGISYQSSGTPVAGGDYLLVAVIEPGYAFGPMPDGWTVINNNDVAVRNIELAESPSCADAAPLAPTVQQATCTGGSFGAPSITLAASTSVIGYTQVGQAAVGRSVIVTAELLRDTDTWATPLPAGWNREGAFAVFPVGPFAKAQCVPADPVVTPARCVNGVAVPAVVTLPVNTNAISYQEIGNSSTSVVIADLKGNAVAWATPLPPGWRGTDSSVTVHDPIDLKGAVCAVTNLAAPEVFHAMVIDTWEAGEVIDLTPIVPASPGIAYRLSGTIAPNGTIIVTADLQDGYDWPDDLPRGWIEVDEDTATHTFVLGTDLEIVTAPVSPVVGRPSCDGNDPVVTFVDTAGVTYTSTGSPKAGGKVTVSAALVEGYSWSDTLPSGWSVVDDSRANLTVHIGHVNCDEADGTADPAPLGTTAGTGSLTVTRLPSTGSGTTAAIDLTWTLIAGVVGSIVAGVANQQRRR